MKALISRLAREDEGQDLIEYALLATLISLAAVSILILLGTDIGLFYDRISAQVRAAAS